MKTWIVYNNQWWPAHWLDQEEATKYFSKPNMHQKKVMVAVWWSAAGLIHYSFLNPTEITISEKYAQQTDAMYQNPPCLQLALVNRKGPILHNSARSDVAQSMLQKLQRASLVVQGLRFQTPNAGGLGSIQGQGTRSHMPQLKILCATTKTHGSQINKCYFLKNWTDWATVLPHLPYSPDLLPTDYRFFVHLDNFLQGKCFHNQQDSENAFQEFAKSQSTDFYATGISKLISCWQKGIDCNDSYFD